VRWCRALANNHHRLATGAESAYLRERGVRLNHERVMSASYGEVSDDADADDGLLWRTVRVRERTPTSDSLQVSIDDGEWTTCSVSSIPDSTQVCCFFFFTSLIFNTHF